MERTEFQVVSMIYTDRPPSTLERRLAACLLRLPAPNTRAKTWLLLRAQKLTSHRPGAPIGPADGNLLVQGGKRVWIAIDVPGDGTFETAATYIDY